MLGNIPVDSSLASLLARRAGPRPASAISSAEHTDERLWRLRIEKGEGANFDTGARGDAARTTGIVESAMRDQAGPVGI